MLEDRIQYDLKKLEKSEKNKTVEEKHKAVHTKQKQLHKYNYEHPQQGRSLMGEEPLGGVDDKLNSSHSQSYWARDRRASWDKEGRGLHNARSHPPL